MKVLVTAIGSMSAGEVIRAIAAKPDVAVYGCNSHPAEWTPASSPTARFWQVPPAADAKAYLEALLLICATQGIDRLIPLTDVEVDIISRARESFVEHGTIVCLPDHQTVSVCRDKLRLHEFASQEGLESIVSWDLDLLTFAPARFPLLAKPRNGRSSQGIMLIEDESDFLHYVRKLTGHGYIVQPQLAGSVCTVDVVRQASSGCASALCRRELVRTTNGAGLVVEILPSSPALDMALKFAELLNVNGCINLEFLEHQERPLLMDANPRFSAGIAFSSLAGYDMAWNHMRCHGSPEGIDPQIVPPRMIIAKHFVERFAQSTSP